MKQTLYCEIKFLTDFFDHRPRLEVENPFSEDSSVEIWKKYRDMILKNADIKLDVKPETFFNTNNPFINMLKKKKGDGEIQIKFNKFPVYFKEEMSHSFIFLADSIKARQTEDDYGMICISSENYMEHAGFLFSTETFCSIDENTNWDILKAFKHPCHSIIIIDNYILSKPEEVLKESIMAILLALLPEKLNKRNFSISIYTVKPVKRNTMADDEYNELMETVMDRKSIVENTIKAIRKPYKIDVSIKWSRSQHDRSLLTNYCLFDSGYGFVLEEKEKKKGTSLHINRITQPQVLQAIILLKDRIQTRYPNASARQLNWSQKKWNSKR